VRSIIDYAVGECRPHLTLYLHVPLSLSESRRMTRHAVAPGERDRMEELDRSFFERVERGYLELAAAEPDRIRVIDATRSIDEVAEAIWREVRAVLSA